MRVAVLISACWTHCGPLSSTICLTWRCRGAASQAAIHRGRCMADNFTFGIEEEYFLVDAETKLVSRRMPEGFLAAAKEATGNQVAGEFLQSQLEVVTAPQTSMAGARAELRRLRSTVAAIAAQHGLAILAAGTHPTALWSDSLQTPKQRYDAVMHDLQMIGHRNMLCGM